MAAGVTAGTLEEDLAGNIKKKRQGGGGVVDGKEKRKIGVGKTERQKWNGGLEGG